MLHLCASVKSQLQVPIHNAASLKERKTQRTSDLEDCSEYSPAVDVKNMEDHDFQLSLN